MASTNNASSLLFQLRALVPRRPLLPGESYRVAELQANRLLQWGGIDNPGTPSELVAELPFVQVVLRHDRMPTSGLTTWIKPRWLILLDRTEPHVRRRFSLMHEFKHVLDHPFIAYLYPTVWDIDSRRRAESVADYFAACLLMPKRLVKRAFCSPGGQDVTALAAMFGVSEVAMRIRLQQLGLHDRPERCAYRLASPQEPSDVTYYRQKREPLEVAA